MAGSRAGRGFVAAAGALAGVAAFGLTPAAPPGPAAAGASLLVLLGLIAASQTARWSPVTGEAAPAAALLGRFRGGRRRAGAPLLGAARRACRRRGGSRGGLVIPRRRLPRGRGAGVEARGPLDGRGGGPGLPRRARLGSAEAARRPRRRPRGGPPPRAPGLVACRPPREPARRERARGGGAARPPPGRGRGGSQVALDPGPREEVRAARRAARVRPERAPPRRREASAAPEVRRGPSACVSSRC